MAHEAEGEMSPHPMTDDTDEALARRTTAAMESAAHTIVALTKRAEQAEAQVRVLRDALTELWQWVGWDEGEEEYRDAVIAGEEGSVSSTIDYTAIRAAAVALATADLADTSAGCRELNALPEAR